MLRAWKLIALLLACTVITGVAWAHISNNSQGSAQKTAGNAQDVGDATPIDGKVKTEKQKKHGRLYKQYAGMGKKNLRTETANGNGNVEGEIMIGIPVLSPTGVAFDLPEFLKKEIRESDAVVVGTVKTKTSQLTEEETFTFTDYVFSVEDILKNNAASPISQDANITITRPGGAVILNKRLVRVADRRLQPLALEGRYLLFLKYIPETDSYSAFDSNGSFKILDGKLYKLTAEQLPKELGGGNDAESFIDSIRSAAAAVNGGAK